MNFLSHFYFDRHSTDPERVMGMVLPDLVKNARKDWCIRPEKHQELFAGDKKLTYLLEGWKRHLEVDRHFHSSAFFTLHTRSISALIRPILEKSDIRASFVAHISLELMLDNLLLTEKVITTERFYEYLTRADRGSLRRFLSISNISDSSVFFAFLDEFIGSAYLNSYKNSEHIIYAIGRICMRIWETPLTDTQKLQLTAILLPYLAKLKNEYMMIFDLIESRINPYTGS